MFRSYLYFEEVSANRRGNKRVEKKAIKRIDLRRYLLRFAMRKIFLSLIATVRRHCKKMRYIAVKKRICMAMELDMIHLTLYRL